VGLALQLSNIQTAVGHSGGPVIDANGQVVGILSGTLRLTSGQDLAIPITNIQPALVPFLPSTGADDGAARQADVTIEGSIQVEISGNGGGDFGRAHRGEARLENAPAGQSPKLSSDVSIAGRGGERSECREDSGRTISVSNASGSLVRAANDALAISFELYAHGGHYRTAGTCLIGEPVGLTGHDTMARSSVSIQAILRVPILNRDVRAIKIAFVDLPKDDALIEVTDPDGVTTASIRNQSSGEHEVAVNKSGIYSARLTSVSQVSAEGGFGENRVRANPRVQVLRIPR
jgi:hypothetical protein